MENQILVNTANSANASLLVLSLRHERDMCSTEEKDRLGSILCFFWWYQYDLLVQPGLKVDTQDRLWIPPPDIQEQMFFLRRIKYISGRPLLSTSQTYLLHLFHTQRQATQEVKVILRRVGGDLSYIWLVQYKAMFLVTMSTYTKTGKIIIQHKRQPGRSTVPLAISVTGQNTID